MALSKTHINMVKEALFSVSNTLNRYENKPATIDRAKEKIRQYASTLANPEDYRVEQGEEWIKDELVPCLDFFIGKYYNFSIFPRGLNGFEYYEHPSEQSEKVA